MEIVQRLLPGDRFGADTNLFDAGLHSLLLARLRGHIDRSFGHTLELSAMYANPTIRAIAKLIREDSGEKQPGAPDPFFFVHAGETLRELVARLGDRPLHGIGFSAPDPQPRSIEEHAGHEVAALLRIHPRGQFLIGGWSASGVLAVEIARRLKELGRDVALVVLFDAPNYAHFLRQTPGTRAAEFFRGHYLRLRYHAGVLRHRPVTEWMQYLQDRLRSLRRSLRLEVVRMQNRHGKAGPKSRYDSDLFVAIATDFVPAQYPGRVLLVRRTERASEWGASWDLGWKDVVTGGLEIQTVPGNHMTMFHEPQVDTLAALLRERFDAVTNHLSG